MFSDAGILQEVLALAIAVLAGAYVVFKVVGLPKRWRASKPPETPVVVGDRLQRALDRVARGE